MYFRKDFQLLEADIFFKSKDRIRIFLRVWTSFYGYELNKIKKVVQISCVVGELNESLQYADTA